MKYINLFETQAEYDDTKKYYPNVSYIEATDEVVYQENDPRYSSYLTFEALQSGTFTLTVPAAVDSTYMTSVSYSTDDGTNWSTTTIDNTAQTITTPTINAGSKVLWKGVGIRMAYIDSGNNYSKFTSTGNFNVSGNIMSLLYGDNFARQTSFASGSQYTFCNLFSSCTKLISAGNLILPATTLACYLWMFSGCSSLQTSPVLPATTLAERCYSNMFYNCTSLTTAPELPATTLANQCYGQMFRNCRSLTTAPELPATTLVNGCYSGMFQNCTQLTSVPSNYLPVTTLVQSCYSSMFSGCTRLTTAPELPATTLATECYSGMFKGCTSLTTAPELPATTLTSYCYWNMFQGCTSLNSIKMLATNISASNCLSNWVQNVAATGTFTKAASMTTLPTGDSGIPSGWTVQNA